MLKHAGLDGFFTNHSLRWTTAMRLFQAGQNLKLIKEVTGHVSDAVEKYEITSDKQRMHVSSIIQSDVVDSEEVNEVKEVKEVVTVPKGSVMEVKVGDVENKNENNQVFNVINSAVRAIGNRKAKLTLHIELID